MPRKINRIKRIQKASEYADRWLMRKQRRHNKMLLKSLNELQNKIIDSLTKLEMHGGSLLTAQQNLRNAQLVHRDIELYFRTILDPGAQAIVKEFQETISTVARSLNMIDNTIEWTGLSPQSIEVLNSGSWSGMKELIGTQRRKIEQAVYNHVIAGERFSTLVSTIEQQLLGSAAKSVTGRPLAQYAGLYARDSLMIYHNEVSIFAAEELGMKKFLYVGDIIATTRDFCKRRAGKVYTKDQIQSWTFRWSGKSGPAMTHRGGYNCRHHWQPVRDEWLEGKKKLNISNWNLEQRRGG